MGFGFNLFFIFIFIPLLLIIGVIAIFSKKKIFSRAFFYMILGILFLVFLSGLMNWINSKTILDQSDYYGEYIIDKSYFPGTQSNWQYDHFRFEIKENDSIYFFITQKENIIRTYKGSITTVSPYGSARLIINMPQKNHHILSTNPTIYRESFNFFMVFNSPLYSNMYFKKGKWK